MHRNLKELWPPKPVIEWHRATSDYPTLQITNEQVRVVGDGVRLAPDRVSGQLPKWSVMSGTDLR
jgi:hypothetical protein